MSLLNQVFREFVRYTGDGLPNEPLNAPLPIGDRSSGAHWPSKAQIRAAFAPLESARDEAAASAALAAAYASDAVSQGNVPIYGSTLGLAALDIPEGLTAIRTCGYTTAGDGGGGLFVRLEAEETGAVQDLNDVWWGHYSDTDEYFAASFGMGCSGDDTTAFETALQFIVERGGVLRLPKGSFTLARDIAVTGEGNGITVQGAGPGLTRLMRGATGNAIFLSFSDINDLTLRDFQIDAQRQTVGDGNHGLRILRGHNVLVERVYVKNWTSAGIIYYAGDEFSTDHYKNVRIMNCMLDAYEGGGALNGIMLANSYEGRIEGCSVLDIGRTGSPNYAIQLKLSNIRSRVVNCYARNADAGIAMGSNEVSYPSNSYCRADNNIVEDCRYGVRIYYSDYCEVTNPHIDMAADNTLEYAVHIDQGDHNRVTGATIRRFDGIQAVYIGYSTGSYVEVAHLWNSVPNDNLVQFATNAIRCKVKVVNYIGTWPAFTDDLATYTSIYENVFELGDGVQSKAVTIAGGVITVRNSSVRAIVLDTAGSAATDDLDLIVGHWKHGDQITLSQASNGRDPTIKHNTGNIYLAGNADVTLDQAQRTLTLMRSETLSGFVRVNNA